MSEAHSYRKKITRKKNSMKFQQVFGLLAGVLLAADSVAGAVEEAYAACADREVCFAGEQRRAGKDEKHVVRCCSDTPIAGFTKNQGCDVYGGALLGGQCHSGSSFFEAAELCAAQGARLCTKVEILSRCTRNTGCGHNHELVWTSTTCGEGDADGDAGPRDSAYIVCGDKGRCGEGNIRLAKKDAPHEVRCCSDTAKPGWTKLRQCSVWGESDLVGGCHHASTFAEAEDVCRRSGGRLCTSEEILKKCTMTSGCGHDEDLVWTSTEDKDLPPVPKPNEGDTEDHPAYVIACGEKGQCPEGEQQDAGVDTLHEVRCCSDTARFGWLKYDQCSVWGESDLAGGCHHASNFAEAKDVCARSGGRLCTRDEILNRCTIKSGCGHDLDLVWTSTPAKATLFKKRGLRVRAT